MSSFTDNRILGQLISSDPSAADWACLSPADWPRLLQVAQREGVGPLLYWRLYNSGKFNALPEAVQSSLRIMYAHTCLQNQKIFNELGVLSRLFLAKSVPVVVLKGACYALTIYPDIGLRPMADLDLLVPASRLPEAIEIAQSLDYADAVPEASPGLNNLLTHHACLRKSALGSITLEIHDRLVGNKSFAYAVSMDWFWDQTEPLNGRPENRFENLRMLTPTAQVLYAASHAFLQHGGNKSTLRWHYDLHQLICVYGNCLDWELLVRQAEKFEWSSALWLALSQIRGLFGTSIPDKVLSALARREDRLTALVAHKRVAPATHLLAEYEKLLSLNWYGRLRLVWAILFPGPAYMRWRYHVNSAWLLPAYYSFRWWGILKDAARTLIELLKKPQVTRA